MDVIMDQTEDVSAQKNAGYEDKLSIGPLRGFVNNVKKIN